MLKRRRNSCMNEWIVVGGIATVTILLLGGGGVIASIVRGNRNKDK